MQQGDYSSSYYPHHLLPPHQNPIPNPNPNPNDVHEASPTTYASAPPFGPNYLNSEYPNNYSQNPDPPTAPPSYVPPPNPNYQSFNNSTPFPSYLPPPSAEQQYPPAQQPSYYSPYDQHQTVPNYIPPPPPQIPSNLNSNSSTYPSQIPSNLNSNSSTYPSQIPSNLNSNSSTYPYSNLGGGAMGYDASYESSLNRGGGSYLDESPGRYGGGGGQNVFGRSRSDLGSDYYDKRPENNAYDGLGQQEVYAYQGGKVEPYGARGTGSKSFTFAATAAFDDYGRSISSPSGKDQIGGSSKVVKAVPKMDTQQDIKNGVQKFRVKLLAESGGQSTMDVLCQIGLDGIRILDPNASRMLRIYPLETVTRSEVTDSSTFTFWSKSSVDIEPRRIRLQSNSYTTNTILDIVTAATFQLKEMGKDSFRSKPSDPSKVSEQLNEKKKGFTDWVNLIKPGNEEKDHWVPDEAITKCAACGTNFGAFVRKHHCRNCGDIFCDKCTQGRIALTVDENAQPVRVCDRCLAEVTQRLSSAKESASKPASLSSHEDLAKKLQEEMERNRKASSGTKSFDGSSGRMKEVACPTCTVHLQVQVPTSGSETIECGVCQHPFLVSAH